MKRSTVVVAAAVVAMAVAGTAPGSSERKSGSLRVNAKLATKWKFGDKYCPPGKPVNISCVLFVGKGQIAGLGLTTSTYVKTMESNGCPITQFNRAVLVVAGKGSIRVTRPGKACGPTAPARVGPLKYKVSEGTGAYKGASGSLTYRGRANSPNFVCGPCGTGEDTWSGTITVPRYAFDVTPPTITGAVPTTVNAPAGEEGVRVELAVTAEDAVDGPRPVSCTPPSGSVFKVGQTTVNCSAIDKSGNTAVAQFTVTVQRG